MRNCLILELIFSMAMFVDPAQEEREPVKPVPFDAFIQRVKDANAYDFVARPGSKVKDASSFEEMRQYILSLYHQVHVSHSYLLGSQTFDCVPIEQQPSVRALGINKIASPPLAVERPGGPVSPTADEAGNTSGCKGRTIPMRRVTLQQLSQFETLKDFFKKLPSGEARDFR